MKLAKNMRNDKKGFFIYMTSKQKHREDKDPLLNSLLMTLNWVVRGHDGRESHLKETWIASKNCVQFNKDKCKDDVTKEPSR